MENDHLAQEILDKIKNENIKPKPKWEFILRHALIWLLVLVCLVFGALATSVIIFMFDDNQWDLYGHLAGNLPAQILATIPIFWLVIVAVFLYFVYLNFKNTEHGYKHSAMIVAGSGILLSVVLGSIFYNLGLGQQIDEIFEARAPFYHQLINQRPRLFFHPEEGVLPGQVLMVISPQQFTLDDFNRREWLINEDDKLAGFPLQPGQRVILLGEQTDNFVFHADEIRFLRTRIHFPLPWPAILPSPER